MSTQQSLLDLIHKDVCQRRHGGNPQSIQAHDRIVHTKEQTYKRILEFIKSQGENGATSKEIAAGLGKQLNTVSGRFAELKAAGRLRTSGEIRGGAAVLILV